MTRFSTLWSSPTKTTSALPGSSGNELDVLELARPDWSLMTRPAQCDRPEIISPASLKTCSQRLLALDANLGLDLAAFAHR